MRRHVRSEGSRKKILRRIREEEVFGFSAEIGSRVFPFRTPPPASIPTAGTRRSTRVFVKPYAAAAADAEPARVLRSGRQISSLKPSNGWIKTFYGAADGEGSDLQWWKNGWAEPEINEEKKVEDKDMMFGVVYSRKRRRSPAGDGKHQKFGIVFARKHQRKEEKLLPLAGGLRTKSRNFIGTIGTEENYVRSGCCGGSQALLVLVESSSGQGSVWLPRILVPIMNWMRRVRFRFWDLAAFVSTGAIACVFAANDIHFLAVQHWKNDILGRNSFSGYGLCKMFGATEFTPLLSVDYSALPHFFMSLHAARIFASIYLSTILPREQFTTGLHVKKSSVLVPYEEHDSSSYSEMGSFETEITVSEIPDVKSNGIMRVIALPAPVPLIMITANGYGSNGSNSTKLRKHRKKRSVSRNSRSRNTSFMNSRFGSFVSHQNNGFVSLKSKLVFMVDPLCIKPLDTCLPDLFDGREESDVVSSPGPHSKQITPDRKNTPIEKIKELRSALAEVRQNIDSACCKANILVTDSDRCWREDGAEVMLEMSDSQEWFIAVRRMSMLRHLHKPQDLKPCVVNRFTHAYMWSGDDGWKLEFCDKWDWYVFKELHMECRERNTQEVPVKIIPMPRVQEVSGYEDDAEPSFLRPDLYIRMLHDEVGRALASEIACYDMDTADEDWLRQFNSSSLNTEVGEGSSCTSEENFEKIMFTFERNAYSSADDASNMERALDLCQQLGKRDMVSVVYDYWLNKRKQKCAPLVSVFQGPPLRKAQLLHKPFLRKKRSCKRQRSQVDRFQAGKGNDVLFLKAEREAQKVQEVESAAKQAAEVAIQLRTSAQELTANADLAVYRSASALGIAEAIHASSEEESPDLDSSILFD